MNSNEKITKGFLFDINNPNLGKSLENSIKNNSLAVVGAYGKIADLDLLFKIYKTRELIENNGDFNGIVRENYYDDGENFTASISFIKNPSK